MAEKSPTNKSSKTTTARRRAAAAASKAKISKENVAVIGVTRQASSFADFIRNHGVVGMAVGLAMGTVASGTVKTIVEGFVNPMVSLVVGTQDKLEVQVWHVEIWGREADFRWGATLSAIITLIATIFVIYLIVHMLKLDRLKKE